MNIPAEVKEAAKGLGTEIVYERQRNGYDVYSIGMPHKGNGLVTPTGLPKVIIYKSGKASVVVGSDALDWL